MIKHASTIVRSLPVLLVLLLAVPALAQTDGTADGWQCPPCGQEHCNKIYPDSGACPVCGMAMIRSSVLKERHKSIAVLIFDGVQITDYTGPYEVFSGAQYDVYLVAKSKAPIMTAGNMSVNPTYDFSDCPEPDVVVVPGGHVLTKEDNPEELAWIKKKFESVELLMSVCNGAVSIAHAGLLEHKSATTHHAWFDQLKEASPTTTVIRDKKWVDNGKIVTAAGLSSGIDAALYVVSRFRSVEVAEQIARWLEYRWTNNGLKVDSDT